ncbi:toll-like receptor 21 [Erpetoichthys calabaricus]|uniref:toll-like receptor 21 n=1 Tax=Erpetoichthys calabaricus TaxID=27687 RepID=UPI0022342CCB|nr:toll-like receptor 21 [Erpetoichthys calabaricus]
MAAKCLLSVQLCYMSVMLVTLISAYSFRNCIRNYQDDTSFNCIQRFQRCVSDLVSDLPHNTRALNISHNLLTRLPQKAFHKFSQLISLHIDFNALETLEEYAFDGLYSLKMLNLSFNKIQHLKSKMLAGLSNLTDLFLNNNNLGAIEYDAFFFLGTLKLLNLRSNKLQNYSQIVKSVSTLTSLRMLDLCYNFLATLNHSCSLPKSLIILKLCNNSLVSLGNKQSPFSFVHILDLSNNTALNEQCFDNLDLGNVKYLQMKFNQISILRFLNTSNIKRGHVDYSGMGLNDNSRLQNLCEYLRHSEVRRLALQSNNISSLQTNTFDNCPEFKIIDFSRNVLKNSKCLNFLKSKSSVQSVTIEHNQLNRLYSCSKVKYHFPHLVNISYRYNRILSVADSAFSNAPNLLSLKLNINNIAFLNKGAFKNLTKLKLLRLDNNLITDLFSSSFGNLSNLQILNLRNNRISVIFDLTFQSLENLEILDLGGNKITHVTKKAFSGLLKLINLYLDRNNIKLLTNEMFHQIQNTLLTLDLQSNQIRYISKESSLSPFKNLTKLRDLKLSEQRPYGITIIPHSYFKGLRSLKSLFLSGNRIMKLPTDAFDDLVNLEFLSLDNSCDGISKIYDGIFRHLKKLRVLNMENMGIQSLTEEVFGNLTNLHSLLLSRNPLQIMNVTIIQNLTSLRYLDLRKCPISCTCDNTPFKNWSDNASEVQIVYFYDLMCSDQSNHFYKFDNSVCYLDIGKYLFLSISPLLILLMVSPIVYLKMYWKIKYTYYIFRSWFNDHWRRMEDKTPYKYDAFISYNSKDEDWVLQQLLPNLEMEGTSFFKLCLHHRDFELGRNIVDNIVDSIYNSRKTICVVSRQYLRSEWCSLEIQMASYRLFHEMKDVLILIFLEKIPNRELSTYHRIRRVMLKKTYIDWPETTEEQEFFWTKLKEALRISSLMGCDTSECEEKKCLISSQ